MGEIHNMIAEKGIDFARKSARSKKERQIVDTAFAVLSDKEFESSALHSGFAFASLPHRATKSFTWQRSGGSGTERFVLGVESGRSIDGRTTGIPYGSIARLILIFVFNEALKKNKPQVLLDSSVMSFLRHMGISRGGKSIAMIREQSLRLAHCKLSFLQRSTHQTFVSVGGLRSHTIPFASDEPLRYNQYLIELDQNLFDALSESPILLRNAAMRTLFGRSMAMDLYIFLAYRLHLLHVPIEISWTEFYDQFGGSYREEWVFVREVKEPLELALAAYPEANVEITEHGLVLNPSNSPVSGSLMPPNEKSFFPRPSELPA